MQAFAKFVRENEGVEDYARFRAVTDRQRKGWHAWPARLRDGTIRKSAITTKPQKTIISMRSGSSRNSCGACHRRPRRAARSFIWIFRWACMRRVTISGGIAEFFVQGVAGGAPPDPVFTKGQNWGFPPMNPEAMRLNRYQYVIAYLRNHFRYAKLLRIDHVMGLHRLYWIPDELTGDKGVYVEYPAEELWAILSSRITSVSGRHCRRESWHGAAGSECQAMKRHDIRADVRCAI